MSLDDTQPEPHESPPAVESERKPLKPGKWYGIIALLCGAEGPFAIAVVCVFSLLGLIGAHLNIWLMIIFGLYLINPLCAIAGIVFGILGRNTEGWIYAYIGLVLSVLCLPFGLFFAYSVLVPCC
jgi:hypothetical protein